MQTLANTPVDIIGQFNQNEIRRILPEIKRQAETKKDFIASANRLLVDDKGRLVMSGVQSFRVRDTGETFGSWIEAESVAGKSSIDVQDAADLPLRRTAERQLCNRLNVPVDFIDRLRKEGQGNTATEILNRRLLEPRIGVDPEGARQNTDKFLVRTLDNQVRSVLSNSYRILDNIDMFYAAAEKLEKIGGEIWQMRLSDDNFQLLAVSKGISGKVTLERTYDPGDGWESRWANLEGDVQYAAISITNSETGGGAATVAPAVMTRVCANFNVWAKSLGARHVGQRREQDGMIESVEAQSLAARLTWVRIRDAIDTVFNPEAFAKYIDTLNGATQRNLAKDVTDPMSIMIAVERVGEKYDVNDALAKKLFANVMQTRDFTQYGLMQATTFIAHELDKSGDADTAREMEIMGGEIGHLESGAFRELVKV